MYEITKDVKAETLSTGRTYFTPHGDFPSITTILGKTADKRWLDKWREKVGHEEADRISKEATDRGELVHKYLERHLSEEDIYADLLTETNDVQLMVRKLIEATQINVTKVYAQEIAVWSPSLKFAGRVDVVGEWRGEPAIIDFKTSRKRKNQSQIKDYYLQCAGYAQCHNELFDSNIRKLVILITLEEGGVQGFYGDMIHYVPDLKYRINLYNKMFKEEQSND
jgi:ATP-dependent exoDNAse (exonuclease V) beta subunit